MTNPEHGKAPRRETGGHASSSNADVTAALTGAERIALLDLRRRVGRDRSRRTWLDLQVGDRFRPYGPDEYGVLYAGPISWREGRWCRRIAIMPVAGGPWHYVAAGQDERLGGELSHVATPDEAAAVRDAWRQMMADARAELAELREAVAA